MKIVRVLKKFEFKGLEFRIALVERPYMNNDKLLRVREVLAPNGGTVPVFNYNHRTPLKEIQQKAIEVMKYYESLSANIIDECTKKL